ncbi:hypothetical protein LCGC14_2606170 [marine sediment metagenome]|uniref:Uncharacterized protein n=1 Tax=marine sediment metagenome TaxID=412755 RepID=A0A0F9AV10_9ZZZZ
MARQRAAEHCQAKRRQSKAMPSPATQWLCQVMLCFVRSGEGDAQQSTAMARLSSVLQCFARRRQCGAGLSDVWRCDGKAVLSGARQGDGDGDVGQG